ncbi:MAG: protoheme IX farnesyltransferase [Prolixibacteraceae bacterium]|nr:protoheme IX farnesyltransferase [Prolixibacteraceae bacterium]
MKQSKYRTIFSIFSRLIRARLSMMVTFSALTGYFMSGSKPDASLVFLFFGIFLLSSGASVLNQVQEYKQDALMKRTGKRPIPAGEISGTNAFLLSVFLIVTGSFLLLYNGWIPVILGLLNVVFYNLIYTPLKTRSWIAILPGALVGGVPPLIGWTSAGYYLFHPNAIFLFIFVCLWQVPHFWLLMIKYGKEYERAGFSSISKILSELQIKQVVFFWGLFTSLFLLLFPLFGFLLHPVLIGTLILTNIYFIRQFYKYLFIETETGTIRKAFILINMYAMVVFIQLAINALI